MTRGEKKKRNKKKLYADTVSSVTELLDVAPIDIIAGMSKTFTKHLPDALMSATLKEQALDMDFLWVSETGSAARNSLTSGLTMTPTVRDDLPPPPSSNQHGHGHKQFVNLSSPLDEPVLLTFCRPPSPPQHSFQDCPTLDIAIIGAHRYGYTPTETEVNFVRKTYASCAAMLTICGGIAVPLQAGILSGKTATGPRFELDMLRALAPGVKWVDRRWVRDGSLWTSGALLNGLDMARAFAEQVWGRERAELVQWLSYHGSWVSREVDYGDGH